MQVLYRCGGGLDVHAKTVVACLIKDGKKQTRTFSTMTDDLLALSDWLTDWRGPPRTRKRRTWRRSTGGWCGRRGRSGRWWRSATASL